MSKKVLIIMGHPAKDRKSFCESLALAYQQGAQNAGHEVKFMKIADLAFDPVLHEGYDGPQKLEPDLIEAQHQIEWADHLVFVYPLWQFMVPALVKGFMERTFIVDFAYSVNAVNPFNSGLLKGKTAQVIQTMGVPSFFYRVFYHSRGAKVLRDGLKFCGIRPVKMIFFGSVGDANKKIHQKYLDKVKKLAEHFK